LERPHKSSNLFVVGSISAVVAVGLAVYFARCKCCKKDKMENILLQDPETKYTVNLIEKEELSHDTRRFRFATHNADQQLGLPIGNHIVLVMKINGDLVIRKYTPISPVDQKGSFDLVVKVYFKGVHPKFPEGGKMTQHLESLKIGDSIQIKGPFGNIFYKGKGVFNMRRKPKAPPQMKYNYKHLGLIAGGSGITPIYQLLQAITNDPDDETTMSLIYANQSEDDILMRNDIETLAQKYPNKVKFWYTVDRAQPGWKYSTGYINEEMIREHLPAPSADTGIFMCGPPPMIKFACIPSLQKVGHKENDYFSF